MSILKWLLGAYGNRTGGHHGGGYNKHGSNKHGYQDYSTPQQNYQQPSNVTCGRCNSINTADAKFCQQCGNSMMPSRCTQCNATLLAESKFCAQCGKARG